MWKSSNPAPVQQVRNHQLRDKGTHARGIHHPLYSNDASLLVQLPFHHESLTLWSPV